MFSDRIRCVIMRGGTSKAVFFHENDLPSDRDKRELVILRAFGSPDLRQIDGLGGANSSTSKVAIIGPSSRPDADVDYTFGQVGVDIAVVGMAMNCGNISSAVGPFAIDEGLVKAVEPVTIVRIFNTNTQKRIIAKVPVRNGKALATGDYSIDGVPGTGARIDIEFEDPGGAVTGKTLPTGRPLDIITICGKPYAVSIVDAANPVVFVRAEDFGLKGTELPSEFENRPDAKIISTILEKIRGEAAVSVGLVPEASHAKTKSPELPKIGFYTFPTAYMDATGQKIEVEDIDITGRLFSMGKMINAYMGTGAVCTIVAANIPGTVVNEIVKDRLGNKVSLLRIGHPFGVMPVSGILEEAADGISVKRGVISRTARRILEGWVFI